MQVHQRGAKEDLSNKRRLMEVLCNFLRGWLMRLGIKSLYSFSFLTKLQFQSLGTKEVASDKQINNPIEEYAEDILSFYKRYEGANQPHYYLESQSEITPRVRESLVNLIVEKHQMFSLDPETLYLTVSIFDRFLSQDKVATVEAKLVAMCAMHIASKYEEVYPPLLQDFTDMWMMRYNTDDVLKMEKKILNTLEWSLSLPTPYMFLVPYMNIEKITDKETICMIFYYSELALLQHFLIGVKPSLIAAACVYTARRTLKRNPFWTEALQRCTGYSEPHLSECAQALRYAHSHARKSRRNAVHDKYSSEKFNKSGIACSTAPEIELRKI